MKKNLLQTPFCTVKHSQTSGKNRQSRTSFHPVLLPHGEVGLHELARLIALKWHLDVEFVYQLLREMLDRAYNTILQGYLLNLPLFGTFSLRMAFKEPVKSREEMTHTPVCIQGITHRLPYGQRLQLKEIPIKQHPHVNLRLNEAERFDQIIHLFHDQNTVCVEEVMRLNNTTRNVASKDLHKMAKKSLLHLASSHPVKHWSYCN